MIEISKTKQKKTKKKKTLKGVCCMFSKFDNIHTTPPSL